MMTSPSGIHRGHYKALVISPNDANHPQIKVDKPLTTGPPLSSKPELISLTMAPETLLFVGAMAEYCERDDTKRTWQIK
jgi:hypothetical protein